MSHPVWYTIRTIMKYKTKEEMAEMHIDEVIAYHKTLELRQVKFDKLILFLTGFCLGGTICTVLMYVAHVA